jgi:non-ribosomal peptide synthase protein (TIGR01720 family)
LPGRGLGYGLLRYLNGRPEVAGKLRAVPQADVSFLYLGQLDQALPESSPFAAARESSGPTVSPRARRSHLLNVNGSVAGGQLQLDWTYSENAHRRATVERLAETYVGSLRGLIRHCLGSDEVGYTPSDFPDAELEQGELDELLAQLSLTE